MALKDNDDVKPEGDEQDVSLDLSQAAVKRMIADAKERGYITYDQLNSVMPPEQVSSEQIEDVMSMLSEMGINIIENEDGEEAQGATITGLPKHTEIGRMAVVHEHVHDVALQVSMSAFFQASPEAAEMLVSAVNDAAGEDALTGQLGLVVDAYGGGGLFTATLVDNDVPVTIVESSPSACADARRNLHEHAINIQQIAFEQWSPQIAGLVIADPARNGLGAAGAENLALTEARKVVLVSCDAVAGARDIRLLMNAGYTCDSITVLDLFPHTPHVEVVSAFTRN